MVMDDVTLSSSSSPSFSPLSLSHGSKNGSESTSSTAVVVGELWLAAVAFALGLGPWYLEENGLVGVVVANGEV
jgi:hypothetical protein